MKNDDTSWMSIADVMSALMMIFMFISITFLYQIMQEHNKVVKKKELYKITLNKALHKEFDEDLRRWKAVITDDNIIRFDSPFKVGSDKIPNDFSIILSEFFPRYVMILTNEKFINEIDEVRVEGHTSYGWGDSKDDDEIYLKNMKLSQQRASNVLAYCYSLVHYQILDNKKWLQNNLRANGISFSKPIYSKTEFEIDMQKSRRVEFRVVTRDVI